MADFQFEVEISAKIQELERALNKATTATQQAAAKMSAAIEAEVDPAFAGLTDTMTDLGEVVRKEEAEFENLMSSLDRVEDNLDEVSETVSNNLEPSFEKMLQTIAKVGAALFLVEGAFKIATAAVRDLSGDTDAAVEALKSLPIFGPMVTAIFDFNEALIAAGSNLEEVERKARALNSEMRTLSQTITASSSLISAQAEEMRALGFDEAKIQADLFDDRIAQLEKSHDLRMRQIRQESEAEEKRIREESSDATDKEIEEKNRLLRENKDLEIQLRKSAQEELEIRKRILAINLDTAEFRKEQEKVQKEENAEAERRVKLAEKTKEAQQAIVDKMKEASKAAAEFMKKALQRAKELKEQNRQATKVVMDANESLDRRMRSTVAKGDPAAEREVQRRHELDDLRKQFEEQIQKAREKGNQQLEKQLKQEQEIVERKLKQIHAIEEQRAAQKEAEEAAKENAKKEEEAKKKAEDAAKKAAEEEKKRAEEAAKIAQAQKDLEEEVATARQDAQQQVAAATVSFATAGGTFVTGASAQVNEAKILNKIQKKSQALLERIAANTGRTGVGFA